MKRSVLITGASKGIGRATALRLAPDFDIIALARSEAGLRSLGAEVAALGGNFTAIDVDLRDPAAVAAGLEGIHCDVLVNNAGVMHKKNFIDLTPDEWNEMVDVNFNALYHVTRAVLPGMIAQGRGHIINVASIAGRSAFTGGTAYAGTKHAVLGFSECLMLEVREYGVKVSTIMPGSVATEFFPAGTDLSWMLKAEDVAESIATVLSMPEHALVYNVEVRAALPKK